MERTTLSSFGTDHQDSCATKKWLQRVKKVPKRPPDLRNMSDFLSLISLELRGEKTKGVYSIRELTPIAEILRVPKNLSKQEMVDEILRLWRNRYPEDFTEK